MPSAAAREGTDGRPPCSSPALSNGVALRASDL